MLHITCLLWEPNEHSHSFSKSYNEEWVEKLYRGFRRNLSYPFRFICFTDRERKFAHPEIEQIRLKNKKPGYGDCIEPYSLGAPMILCGLDTIIVANIDHLAEHCMIGNKVALPLDPYDNSRVCNGVALVPQGHKYIHEMWSGENDMEWLRKIPHDILDKLFPGQIVSYKGHVKKRGLKDARIVYFHGHEKPPELKDEWIRQHWI